MATNTVQRAGVLVALVLLVPSGALAIPAQERVQIVHDVGQDRTTRAGTVNTFGWLLLTDDGAPAFHQDAVFTVQLDNQTLLRTTPSSGHDYDGIDTYHVTFPHEGTFTVHATVHDDGTARTDTLQGTVLPRQGTPVNLTIDAPDIIPTGDPATITLRLDPPPALADAAVDVQLHLRRADDAFETFRTTLHTAEPNTSFSYAFDRADTYTLTAVATPTGPAPNRTLAPDAATTTLTATENPPPPTPPTPTTKQPLTNARDASTNGDYTLYGTYDPYTTVGPNGRIRLAALAVNTTTGTLAPNVAYDAELVDPYGRTLIDTPPTHRPSGIFELATAQATPGEYTLHLEASKGTWSDALTLSYGVLPPTLADDAGALLATPNTTQTPHAGTPFQFPLHVTDATGQPAAHTEIDWRLLNADNIPLYAGKVHTHSNGTFPLTLTFPEAGTYTLETLPEHLEPAPTLFTYGAELGEPPIATIDVNPGPSLDTPNASDSAPETRANQTPGLPLIAPILILVALACLPRP